MSFDEQLKTALKDLARAAAEERSRAVAQAVEAASADVRRQAQGQLAQLRETAQNHHDELRRSAESQINDIKRTADEAQRFAEDARSGAEQRLAATQSERDAARRDADTTRKDLESVRRELDAIRTEVDRIRKNAAAEAEELVVRQLAEAAGAAERRQADAVERTRTDSHQVMLAQTARIADAVRAIDEARALGEVLDALADSAGREVDRAAVLIVRNERLVGWRLSGFTVPGSARAIDLSFEEAGLPGAVVKTGVAVSRPAVEPGQKQERQPALPPFAQDAGGRHALALPVIVGGSVVAVLYADAPRLDAPSASSRWPAVLDVLARHASRALEALTVQQAVGLSLPRPVARSSHATLPGPIEQATGEADADAARRYARILVSEIRMYNEPLVDAGRHARDLLSRLGGEIARARRLYEQRVPPSLAGRADYFDQELVRTLADGDRTLLGGLN